jgi:hypothetical protein
MKSDNVKRTYIIPDKLDVEIKIKAAKERVRPDYIVLKALEKYVITKKK